METPGLAGEAQPHLALRGAGVRSAEGGHADRAVVAGVGLSADAQTRSVEQSEAHGQRTLLGHVGQGEVGR